MMKKGFNFIYHNHKSELFAILILASILVPLLTFMSSMDFKCVNHINNDTRDFLPITASRERSPTPGVNIETQNSSYRSEVRDNTVTFVLNVTNTGDADDTIEILTLSTKIWSITLFYTGNWTLLTDTDGDNITDVGDVTPLATIYVGVNITIPSSAAGGETNIIIITANSSQNASITSAVTLTIFALNPADYASIGPIPDQTTEATVVPPSSPSRTIPYYLNITNNGNFSDTMDITKSAPQSWTVTLLDENFSALTDTDGDAKVDTGNLTPNATKQIVVNVTIPSEIRYNYSYTTSITITSSWNTSRSISVNLRTCLFTAANIGVAGNASLTGKNGDTLIHTIAVSNFAVFNDTVNILSAQTDELSVEFFYENGTRLGDTNGDGNIDVGSLPTAVPINVNMSISVSNIVRGNVTYSVVVTGISSNNDTERKSITVSVTIDPVYNVLINIENQSKECDAGENVTCVFGITNSGNVNDAFDIELDKAPLDSPVTYTIYKNGTMPITNTQGLLYNDTGTTSKDELTNISIVLSVPKDKNLINTSVTFSLIVYSASNASKYVGRTLWLNITKPPYVIFTPTSITNKSGRPGTTSTYNFTLINNGFEPDDLMIDITQRLYNASTSTLLLDAPPWNFTINAGNLILATGNTSTYRSLYYSNQTLINSYDMVLSVDIPYSTSTDIKNTITINVSSTKHGENRTSELSTTIQPIANLYVTAFNLHTSVWNATTNYTIRIENRGSVKDTMDITYSSTRNWPISMYYNATNQLLTDTDGDGAIDVGNLSAGSYIDILVKEAIPRMTVGGTTEIIAVKFTSSFDQNITSTVNLTNNVTSVYDISITPTTTSLNYEVDTWNVFNFSVTNNGNVNDTFEVSIPNLRASWIVIMDTKYLPTDTQVITLNQNFNLSTAIYAAREDPRYAPSSITLTIRLTSKTNIAFFLDTNLVITIIKPEARFIFNFDNATKSGNAGDEITYTLTIKNNDLQTNDVWISSIGAEKFYVTNQTKIGTVVWQITYTDDQNMPLQLENGNYKIGQMLDNASKSVRIKILTPSNESSDYMTKTTFSVSSGGTSPYSASLVIFTRINVNASVDIYVGQATITGKPNTTVNSTIIVVNNGTSSDTLNVLISSNWTARLLLADNLIADTNYDGIADVGNLSHRSSVELKLSVYIPPDVNRSTNDTITITVFSSQNSSKLTNITITMMASAVADHLILVDKYNDTSNPNNTVFYNLTILNKGNAPDVVNIQYTSSLGWNVRLLKESAVLTDTDSDGFVDIGVLARNESRNVTIEVAIPSNAAGEATNVVGLVINSTLIPTYNTNIVLNTIANAIVDFYIGPNTTQKAYPTKTFNCTIGVTNLGNVPDIIDINYTTPEGWQVTAYKMATTPLQDSNNNEIVDTGAIGAKETLNITFRISAPSNAQDNKTIIVIGSSYKDTSMHKSAEVFIEIDTTMKIELNTTKPKLYGNVNRSVEFALTVLNHAEYPNSIGIQNSQLESGWGINYYLNETPLVDTNSDGIVDMGVFGRYESKDILVRVFVSPDAQLYNDYKITITANTSSKSNSIDLTVTPVSHTVSLISTESTDKNGDPGSTLSYNFTLRNSGSTNETFKVSVSSSRKWGVVIRDINNITIVNSISVPTNGEIPLTAKISIPISMAFNTTEVTTITMYSEGNESNQDVIRLTSRVNKLINVTVSIGQSTVRWNWSVTKQQICVLTIKNTGNTADAIYIKNTTLPWSSIKYYPSLTTPLGETVIVGSELDYNDTLGYCVGSIEPTQQKIVSVFLEDPPSRLSAIDYYDITFTVSSSNLAKKDTSKLKIDTRYAAIILNTTSNTTTTISPTGVAKFTLTLTNDGNTRDNIKVNATSINSGWGVKISSPSATGSFYSLQPKTCVNLTIELTPPQGMKIPLEGSVVNRVSITAASDWDKSISSTVSLDSVIRPNIGFVKQPLGQIPPIPPTTNITISDDKGSSIDKIFANQVVTIKIPINATEGVDFSGLRVTIKVGNDVIRNNETLSTSEAQNKSIIFTYKFKSVGIYNTTFSINSGSTESSAIDNQISLMIEISKADTPLPNWIIFLPTFAAAITVIFGTVYMVRAQRIKKRNEKEAKEKLAREREEGLRKRMMEGMKRTAPQETVRVVKKKKSAAERKKILEESSSGRMTDFVSKEKGATINDDKVLLSFDFSSETKEKGKEVDDRRKAIDLGEFAVPQKKAELREEDAMKLVAEFQFEPKKHTKKAKKKSGEETEKKIEEKEAAKETEEKAAKEAKEETKEPPEEEKKKKKKPPRAVIVEDGHEVEWG